MIAEACGPFLILSVTHTLLNTLRYDSLCLPFLAFLWKAAVYIDLVLSPLCSGRRYGFYPFPFRCLFILFRFIRYALCTLSISIFLRPVLVFDIPVSSNHGVALNISATRFELSLSVWLQVARFRTVLVSLQRSEA